ncbi:MAG: hypothetical protein IJY69_04730 [Clostridia bacterium]|nr:hypothetical protein [Clostridia bacterium]
MNIKSGAGLDLALLKNPPLDCEVTYCWIWNESITKEGIDERLEGFLKAGIKSLYILPLPKDFRPDTLRTFLSPEYLTANFWEIMEYALRKCVALGMKPWIYDEGGWPSGAAGGRTALQNPNGSKLNTLLKREITLKKGERYDPCEEFIALFDGKNRLPENYVAQETVNLFEYYFGHQGPNHYFIDFTDPTVTETFISNTYEGYKSAVGDLFGNVIPLFFTDEPGLSTGKHTFPKQIFKDFITTYGYDLRDYLYVISDGDLPLSENENQIRIDYYSYISDKFYENYFVRLSEWCENNGIAYSGHLMADNYPDACLNGYSSILDTLRLMHIPGIDVIWEQIRWPYGERAPVDEEETARMPFFPRLAPSAARQMGRNLALTETLSIYGDGISPDEIRYVTNYQAVRGINVFNFLNLPYGKTRCSALMMRPAFCPEKPGFLGLKQINGYYARLAYLLRLGYADGDTALYHPIKDYMACKSVSDAAVESFRLAGVTLEEKNIAFDIIDDKGILSAEDTADGLKLGDAVYRHIVVPENKYMPDEVKTKIAAYLTDGEPTYVFTNKKLRVLTRSLDNGRLWFVFNEGEPTVTEKLNIADGQRVYRLDLHEGNIYSDEECVVTLDCGDMAVYLVTDTVYKTDPNTVEYSAEATDFKAVSYKRLVIDYDGLGNEYGEGEPVIDADFSGEITYRGNYTLPKEPAASDTFRITLEDFGVTAVVGLNGKNYSLAITPMSFTVSGSELKKRGEFTVTVANTAANEILAKNDVINMHPKAEVGVYTKRMHSFEARRHPLKLGHIVIEKLV